MRQRLIEKNQVIKRHLGDIETRATSYPRRLYNATIELIFSGINIFLA